MNKIQMKQDKLLIVLHETYGINQHLVDLCDFFSKQNFDVICPNLLGKEMPYDYSEEEEAYRHFMNNVGFNPAIRKVKNILLDVRNEYSKIFIAGFSVGATVAWVCSEENDVDGIVGFYGSRIRYYVNISRKCPTLLFFPDVENSFNVGQLILTYDKRNSDVHIYKGEHGFCDPYSSKYNKKSAQNSLKEVLIFFNAFNRS